MGNSTQESNVTATGLKKTAVVQTEKGPVTVHRLAFLEYAELLRAIKRLPKGLGGFLDGSNAEDFKNSSTADMLEKLLPLMADSFEDLVDVVAVATDKDAKFIADLPGYDGIEVIAAALDLNNYKKITAAIKKLMPQKPTEENPSDEAQNATQ